MIKKVRASIFFTAIFSLTLTSAAIIWVFYGNLSVFAQSALTSDALLIREGYKSQGVDYLKAVGKNSINRITLIEPDGKVVFDSFAPFSTLDNHLNRPEVASALENGSGNATRQSQTLATQTNYYAVKLNDGKVLRLACTTHTLVGMLLSRLPILGGLVVIIIALAGLITQKLTRQIVTPILKIDLYNPLDNTCYDELSPLLLKLENQKSEIDTQIKAIVDQKTHLERISFAMNEGLVLIDSNKQIAFFNPASEKLFHGISNGQNYLFISRELSFVEMMEKAFLGVNTSCTLTFGSHSFELFASSVKDSGVYSGVMLFTVDITEKKDFEKMRREFSANVSHELKTPLTSILGYSEIMSTAIAKPEDTKDFAKLIHKEATRLLVLIDDIISLSRLDEGLITPDFVEMNLLEIAKDVIKNLSGKAEKLGISLTLKGESAVLMGVPVAIREMIANLVDNAIIYNKPGGFVEVEVENPCKIVVRDNGIGISKEHQDRIWERFYRVDKSHSKSSGGTGLGLSIVKNTTLLHNATLTLESDAGQGTAITITF